jgi:hypothetical protein
VNAAALGTAESSAHLFTTKSSTTRGTTFLSTSFEKPGEFVVTLFPVLPATAPPNAIASKAERED